MDNIFIRITGYEGTTPVQVTQKKLVGSRDYLNDFSCAVCIETVQIKDGYRYRCDFSFEKNSALPLTVGVGIVCENWSKENYVFVPGAVYNGNRYCAYQCDYPPRFHAAQQGVCNPIMITDVPRLSICDMQSAIQLTTGDASTPCMGYYDANHRRGFLLYTTQRSRLGNHGLTIREDLEKEEAVFQISAPAMREKTKYTFGGTTTDQNGGVSAQIMDDLTDGWPFGADKAVSDDQAHFFQQGETISLEFSVHVFDAGSIHAFYEYFFDTRKSLETHCEDFNSVPFSIAYGQIEKKYNQENFKHEYGYYAVGTADGVYQDFQSGWVGGGINSFALMKSDHDKTIQRSISTVRFIVDRVQNARGWYRAIFYKGEFFGDNYNQIPDGAELLVRRHCDMIYYLTRQYDLLLTIDPKLARTVQLSVCKACDALARIWELYGQFGQIIDSQTDRILMGNTACAGIAPAALVLVYNRFGNQTYLRLAEKSAEKFYREFICAGFVNGGPGDILQCADSESIHALLESFMELYLCTHEEQWLLRAKHTAYQCSSWCVSYDYAFPENSCFAKLKIHTTGSVFANIQNKHSAPGFCTLAGEGLLQLYRFTGDIRFLEQLRDTAHGITQYVVSAKTPVWDFNGNPLPYGYVNERVNMSDWEGKACVGGVFAGSTWAEVACLLTCTEVPGIYINTFHRCCMVFDHVEAKLTEQCLNVFNPTDYDLLLRIVEDDGNEMVTRIIPMQAKGSIQLLRTKL